MSVAQAAPVTIATKAKAVKKCTLKKKASCKSKGVTKQKVGKKDLSGIKLSKGKVTGSKFTGTKLIKADFSGATVTGTTFSNSNLDDANFKGAKLKNVTFDANTNLNSVDFSGATLDHVTFKKTKPGTGGSAVRIRSVTAVCASDISSCHSPNFAGATLFYVGFYGVDYPNLNFARATILFTDISSSYLNYADFSFSKISYLTVDYSTFEHSKFIGMTCSSAGYIVNVSVDNSNFTDASGACLSGIKNAHNQNSYSGTIGLDGFGKLKIDYNEGPKPSAVAVFESKNGMAYNRVCDDPNDCTVNLQVGLDATVKVWTPTQSRLHLGGFDCDDPIRDANNDNQYVNVCRRTILASDKGKTYSGIIDSRNRVVVRVGTPLESAWPKTMSEIIIKVNGAAVKTCLNAAVCDAFVSASGTIVVSVSSNVAFVVMQKRGAQDLYTSDPPIAGVYTLNTPGLTLSEDTTFDASLS
jgi:uncharacterized protein YjbI with pentapeptide repeats